VRFLGLTGHHDPAILLEAMQRFNFDTVLVALNAADVHRLSFISTVLADAAARGMGVIAMKTCVQGALLGPDKLTMHEALGYALSLPGVSLAIVGCQSPGEVDENVQTVRRYTRFAPDQMRELERRTRAYAAAGTYYKRS